MTSPQEQGEADCVSVELTFQPNLELKMQCVKLLKRFPLAEMNVIQH